MSESSEGSALAPYSRLNAGLEVLQRDYAIVPDFKTKEGYAIGKANLKEYRDYKKRVNDTHKIAKEDIIKTGKLLDGEKNRILTVLEDVFEPHKEARKVEDERQETIKREKAEAKAKREREIKDRIDTMREAYAAAVSMSSAEISWTIESHDDYEITEELFGDEIETAKAVKSALAGKLKTLYESKKQQEEEAARIKKESEELKVKQEAQRLEDEKRAKEQQEKDEADRKRMAEENAKLKAENEALQAERKKLDDEKAAMEAEKKKIEDDKQKVIELEREAKVKEVTETLKKAAEKEEKKRREEAEKLAKEEAKERRTELEESISNHISNGGQYFDLINAIENQEIPYLRIDWTEK